MYFLTGVSQKLLVVFVYEFFKGDLLLCFKNSVKQGRLCGSVG